MVTLHNLLYSIFIKSTPLLLEYICHHNTNLYNFYLNNIKNISTLHFQTKAYCLMYPKALLAHGCDGLFGVFHRTVGVCETCKPQSDCTQACRFGVPSYSKDLPTVHPCANTLLQDARCPVIQRVTGCYPLKSTVHNIHT